MIRDEDRGVIIWSWDQGQGLEVCGDLRIEVVYDEVRTHQFFLWLNTGYVSIDSLIFD